MLIFVIVTIEFIVVVIEGHANAVYCRQKIREIDAKDTPHILFTSFPVQLNSR